MDILNILKEGTHLIEQIEICDSFLMSKNTERVWNFMKFIRKQTKKLWSVRFFKSIYQIDILPTIYNHYIIASNKLCKQVQNLQIFETSNIP